MASFLDIWQYMPHGMCLLWQPWLVMLWAGSDLLIFAAYMVIPTALLRVARGRDDLRHRGLVILFAAFILLCGLTHLMGAITLWWPIYPIVGVLKFVTGVVSAVTAVALVRLVPVVIGLPGPSELEEVNRQLREKIAQHEAAVAELEAIKNQLEEKVTERTEALNQANERMAVVAREAVHRSKNLLAVVVSIARQSARGQSDIQQYVKTLTDRIGALASATQNVTGGQLSGTGGLKELVENQLEPLQIAEGRNIRIEGPDTLIGSETAQQIGLAVHELATNTRKYGAIARGEGDVRITWEVRGEGEEEALRFEWSETFAGSEEADENAPKGFGHTLLTRVVPTMLQARAERKVEDQKLVYSLEIPTRMLIRKSWVESDEGLAGRIVERGFNPA